MVYTHEVCTGRGDGVPVGCNRCDAAGRMMIKDKHKILENPLPPPPLYGRAGVADDARRRRLGLVQRGGGGERGI